MKHSKFGYRPFGILALILMMTFGPEGTKAQKTAGNKILHGLIRDAQSHLGVNAAQIQSLGSKTSATTDEKGGFSLELKNPEDLLKVTAFDHATRIYPVQGKDSVYIELYSHNFSNYYRSIENEKGTTEQLFSVSSLSSVLANDHSGDLTVDQMLEKNMTGDLRSVSRSGTMGMGSALFVRGMNSLNMNSQPLFVIDGVVWNGFDDVPSIHAGYLSNPLDVIDINDIESMTLLKDGTSIYGSKATNGVIIIRTHRAVSPVTEISLNLVTGSVLTPNTLPMMNASQFKTYITDMIGSSGMTQDEINQLPYLNENPARSTYNQFHNNTDWNQEIYRNGLSKAYSINVKGGDDKAMYYLSLGYTGIDGVVKTTNMERYNMRINADIHMTPKIDLGVNLGFSKIDRIMQDDGVNSTTSLSWLAQVKSPLLSPYNYTSLGVLTSEYAMTDIFGQSNPAALLEYTNNTLKKNFLNVTLRPVFKLSEKLTLTEHFDYSNHKTSENYYRPYLFAASVDLPGTGRSYNSRSAQILQNSSTFNDLQLDYKLDLSENGLIDLRVGNRFIYRNFESDYVEGHNSGSNTTVNLPGSFRNLRTMGVNNLSKSISNYFQADWNLQNKWFAKLAMSMDASSRFGEHTRGGVNLLGVSWGLFPSLQGAWLMSSEDFMKEAPAVSMLKFRAGYGITGNDNIFDYQTAIYFSSIRYMDVANGAVLSNLYNPELQWENTGRANMGMDLGLFNDRLLVNLDVFTSRTDNLLLLKKFQDIAGLRTYWGNGGSLYNQGIEATLTARLVKSRDFQWETGIKTGNYQNKILSLPGDIYSDASLSGTGYISTVYGGEVLTQVGQSAGVFYGYKTQGVFSSRVEAEASGLKIRNSDGTYSTFGAGDVKFEDVADANGNKDGVIDENDRQIIGNPNPLLYGAITNDFHFKRLTLTALVSYSYGNDVYNYQRSLLESGKDFNNQTLALNSRWTASGQETLQPRAVYGDPMGNARFSDRWIEDGSYIKLKSLGLSYDLSIKSRFLEDVKLWVSAENLLTLTNYLGSDPETAAQNSVMFQGVDAGLIPLSKAFYLGVKLKL